MIKALFDSFFGKLVLDVPEYFGIQVFELKVHLVDCSLRVPKVGVLFTSERVVNQTLVTRKRLFL